jgi:hypothetical protein
LGGDVEHGISSTLPREPDDHLAGVDDLAGLGANGGDDALRVSPQLGEINLIVSCCAARPILKSNRAK